MNIVTKIAISHNSLYQRFSFLFNILEWVIQSVCRHKRVYRKNSSSYCEKCEKKWFVR